MPSVSSSDDPHLVQRLEDLDPVGADVRVEPVVVDGVAEVHGGLLSPRRTRKNASLVPRLG